MKKILLILLLTIFFVPKVNAAIAIDDPLQCFDIASPSSTKNIFKSSWSKDCGYSNKIFLDYAGDVDTRNPYYCIDDFIEVEPDTTYTLTHFDVDTFQPIRSAEYNRVYIFDDNFNELHQIQDWYFPPYNFTTPSNGKYLLYCTYGSKGNAGVGSNRREFQLEKGKITNTSELTYVAYEEYVEPEPEPELPPVEPEDPVVPVPADTTLDTFYSIYLDKLSTATTYATENKFLLGFIGIILSFIILELVLKLFRNGGYH